MRLGGEGILQKRHPKSWFTSLSSVGAEGAKSSVRRVPGFGTLCTLMYSYSVRSVNTRSIRDISEFQTHRNVISLSMAADKLNKIMMGSPDLVER